MLQDLGEVDVKNRVSNWAVKVKSVASSESLGNSSAAEA
jgi:hypothetical protein